MVFRYSTPVSSASRGWYSDAMMRPFFEAVHHCFLHMDDFFHDGVQLFLAERFVNGVTQLTKAFPLLVVCVQGAGSVLFTEHRVVFPLTCIISGDFGAIKNL